MAITTVLGAAASATRTMFYGKGGSGPNAIVGRCFSYWPNLFTGGITSSGALDTTLNGVALSSPVTGQFNFTNPASGNTYLANLRMACSNSGCASVMLADRLWHNGGIDVTSTSSQAIVSPTFPARDIAGSTNGDGVFLMLEVSVATGAGTPTITVSYTNQAGTSGRTATNIDATAASVNPGYAFRLSLQAGDTGVRSVQSITLSATWTSGTINLVAYRPIVMMEVQGVPACIDAVTSGFPRLYNDSVLFMMSPTFPVSATTALYGSIQYAQG